MITTRKRKYAFSVLLTMLILFSTVCSSATVVYAKDSSFDMSGKVYELDKDSHYDYSSASSTAAQAGENTFGKFSVFGNARANGDQGGFASYEVNGGTLSFSYSFDKKLLEKDEYEWCIYEDSGKEVAGIKLEEKIKNGAIIIQASLDGKNWVTEQITTNAFTNDSDLSTIYSTKDIQLQNGCYFRVIIAYEMCMRTEDGKFVVVKTKNYDYKKITEVYEFYTISSGEAGKTTSSADTPRKEIGKKINTGKDNGYSGEQAIDKDDPHYGWELGTFVVNGYTRETTDNGTPVFLKNLGDKVTLWFHLNQDITCLNKKESLSISEDTNGYDQKFEVPQTNFKHGALIIRYTDYQGVVHDPDIYTDYLAANARTGADTRVQLFEEGDYEVSLDYEIKNSPRQVGSVSIVPTYTNYKILFKFSIRNGNCMVFPLDNAIGNELANQAITKKGFKLDMAKSRYLTIDVQRSLLSEAPDGTLVEDVRFNRPAKDGESYTDEGIYTFTVKNLYTGESTTKTIYVGESKYLSALSKNSFSVADLNNAITLGGIVGDNGSITIPVPVTEPEPIEPEHTEPKPTESSAETTPEQKTVEPTQEESTISSTEPITEAVDQVEENNGNSSPVIFVVLGLVVAGGVVLFVKKKPRKDSKEANE